MTKHGIESRWGHHRFWNDQPADQSTKAAAELQLGLAVARVHEDPPVDQLPQHLTRLLDVLPKQRAPLLEVAAQFRLERVKISETDAPLTHRAVHMNQQMLAPRRQHLE